jgi:hypothetical protein
VKGVPELLAHATVDEEVERDSETGECVDEEDNFLS